MGSDGALTYPSNLQSFPDEHTTVIPLASGSDSFFVFAAGKIVGQQMGTVVLETTDLQTVAVERLAADRSGPGPTNGLRWAVCENQNGGN
ncbi:MAG: hypothetical protein ABSA52_11140 [Candidatus Binatia bacterium]